MSNENIIQPLSEIRLRNNLGYLNFNNPFQLFGAHPNKGSFLMFWSNELSNKEIKQIILQINWLEEYLPLNFANYYEGYNLGFKNTSFKVAFSLFYKGKTEPLHESSFSLFEEYRNNGTLSLTSSFYLNLNRKLILAEPPSKSEYTIGECFIKMELVNPKEGFGQSQFNRIFPETIMHNAKWWNKKRKIPSQPFIPVARKIDISMTY